MNIRKVSEEQLLPRSSDKSFTTPPSQAYSRRALTWISLKPCKRWQKLPTNEFTEKASA